MIARSLFGLAALLPAGLNAPPLAAGSVLVRVCSGEGAVRLIDIPWRPAAPGPGEADEICAKACHAGGQRKRSTRHI